GDPSPLRFAERRGDCAFPLAFGCLPAERHTGAAVLVVRLEHESMPVAANALAHFFVDHACPWHVPPNRLEIAAIEKMVVALVGQNCEERFLVRDLGAEDAPCRPSRDTCSSRPRAAWGSASSGERRSIRESAPSGAHRRTAPTDAGCIRVPRDSPRCTPRTAASPAAGTHPRAPPYWRGRPLVRFA